MQKESDGFISYERGAAPLSFHHEDKQAPKFYQINAPYELTYIVCSGTGEEDYVNSATFSGDSSYMSRETYAHHVEEYRSSPGHYHDYFEIMVVLSGNVTQKIEGKEYRYPAGSCCMVSRSICHYEGYEGEASLLFFGFSTDYILSLFEHANHSFFQSEKNIYQSELYQFIKEDIEHPGRKNYLDFFPSMENNGAYEILHDLTTRVIDLVFEPHFGSGYLVAGYLCSFLHHLSEEKRYLCSRVNLSVTNEELLFTRITNLLRSENGRISRKDLEKAFCYSGDYINRIVKKYSGKSLYDYGMIFCMQEAARRLLETDGSVSEIAEELGFSNRTHFYHIFKEHYGRTPKEYRKYSHI